MGYEEWVMKDGGLEWRVGNEENGERRVGCGNEEW